MIGRSSLRGTRTVSSLHFLSTSARLALHHSIKNFKTLGEGSLQSKDRVYCTLDWMWCAFLQTADTCSELCHLGAWFTDEGWAFFASLVRPGLRGAVRGQGAPSHPEGNADKSPLCRQGSSDSLPHLQRWRCVSCFLVQLSVRVIHT